MSEDDISFITDSSGNRTHAVIPIQTYRALAALKDLVSATGSAGKHDIYTFSNRKISATGYPDGPRHKPKFVIIKDSQAALMPAESLPENVKSVRESFLDNGTLELDPQHNCFVFTKDITVPSPSFAAALVSGSNRSGLDAWVSREGFSLKQSGYGVHSAASSRRRSARHE